MKREILDVLFVATSAQIGGAEKILLKLIHHFHCFENKKLFLLILKDEGPLIYEMKKRGIPHQCLNLKGWRSIFSIGKIIKFIFKYRTRVVVSFLYHANILARLMKLFLSAKFVVCGQRNIDPWRRWGHSWMDRITHGLCEKIVANSQIAKDRLVEIEKINPDKILVIYNGVDPIEKPINKKIMALKTSFNLPKDKFLFTCVASLEKKKGLTVLIDAFELYFQQFQDSQLLIAGEGRERAFLEQVIHGKGLSEHIKLMGLVSPVEPLLFCSDVFVLSSLWEGVPNALLEALSCGLPIVATDVGGVSEIVDSGRQGLLVPPNDSHKLFEAMKRLRLDPDLRDCLGKEAKSHMMRNYQWENMLEEYTDVIQPLWESSCE